MYKFLKRVLLDILKVPADPEPPAGSPESIRIFRASPRLFQWNLVYWAFLQVFAFVGLLILLGAMWRVTQRFPYWLKLSVNGMELFGFVSFLAQLPLTFWKQKLDYEMRWYIVTDRSLRIRSGVWSVREITMTFANVQKVQLKQGPLQRLLGLATVEVTSAGGGAVQQDGKHAGIDRHAAKFEGVDNAAEIRDFILERLRRYRNDAGLGDLHEEVDQAATSNEAEAAESLVEAARELRVALENMR